MTRDTCYQKISVTYTGELLLLFPTFSATSGNLMAAYGFLPWNTFLSFFVATMILQCELRHEQLKA